MGAPLFVGAGNMSKSKCETELEAMTEERNHWRELAQARDEENRTLRNQIERQAIISSVFLQGAPQRMSEEIAHLQNERDAYEIAIFNGFQTLEKTYNDSCDATERNYQQLLELTAAQGMPRIAQLLIWMHETINGTLNDEHVASVAEARKLALGQEPSPDTFVGLMIQRAMYCGALVHANSALHISFTLSNDPALIADDALTECEVFREPAISTLRRLTPEWMRENLVEAPANHATLAEGLKQAHAQKMSAKSIEAFAGSSGITARTLARYCAWYDTLTKIRKRGR